MKRYRMIFFLLVMMLSLGMGGCKKEYIHVGSNWDAVHTLEASDQEIVVKAWGEESARVGDELSYRVRSNSTGRLWMVQVDPDDKVTLLFPNELEQDNTITADRIMYLPAKGSSWFIEASEPKGVSVVAFVVTSGDTDIEEVLGDEKSMAKAIRIVEAAPQWGLAKIVVEIE